MVLRKKLAVLLAAMMMLGVMSVPPAMAVPAGGFHINNGHKLDDGSDANQGGGQEKAKHPHPVHGGGSGGDNGGGND